MKEGRKGEKQGWKEEDWRLGQEKGIFLDPSDRRFRKEGMLFAEHLLTVKVVRRPPSLLIYLILPTGNQGPEAACSSEHLEAGTHSSERLNKMLKITQQVNECLRF